MNKLKWQTGMPPKDGWYWRLQETNNYPEHRTINIYIDIKWFTGSNEKDWNRLGVKWAGPIPEPEESDET